MNKEDLNKKIWYRAIKTVFVLAFIGTEIIGLFFAHSLATEPPRGYTYAELQQLGAKPVKMTRAEYQFKYGVEPVSSVSSVTKEEAIAELARRRSIPKPIDVEQAEQNSLLTKAILLGIKPNEVERESIGKLPISDSDFLILKSNIEKMVGIGIRSRDIDSYARISFEKFDRGEHLESLVEYKPNLYKYSLIERVGIYLSFPLIILILFVLLSRIFYYIFLGEKFLSLKSYR